MKYKNIHTSLYVVDIFLYLTLYPKIILFTLLLDRSTYIDNKNVSSPTSQFGLIEYTFLRILFVLQHL